MALLNGQSWGSSCPYLWDFCGSTRSCDGCQADTEQWAGQRGAGWVKGTTPEHRHRVVREIAARPGTVDMEQLMRNGTGWFG